MRKFMLEAIRFGEKGSEAWPNPRVGAVVVKHGKVVGRGYHKMFGKEHAEVGALEKAGKKASGGELFVTLEPCSHYGKRPPCTKAIIKAGIDRVHIASLDPNKDSGNGAKELRKHGIKVDIGLCKKEAKKLNNFYITNIGLPEITLKIAMSKDGFISFKDGKREKVSGKEAFGFTQKLRAENDAIIIGINTLLKDNPRLSVRKNPAKNPLRVVLDSKARTPPEAKALSEKGHTVIFCSKQAPKNKVKKLLNKGMKIIAVKGSRNKVDLKEALEKLYSFGVKGVLVEPGNKLGSSFLEKGLFDKLILIIADKEFGKGLKAFKLKNKIKVKLARKIKLGKDLALVLEK